jgi:hypothetical protein
MKVEQLKQIINERNFEPEVKQPLEEKLQSYGGAEAEASPEQVQEFRALLLNLKKQKEEEVAALAELKQFNQESYAELEQIETETNTELDQIDVDYEEKLAALNDEEVKHLAEIKAEYEALTQGEKTAEPAPSETPKPSESAAEISSIQ